jgi:hypothetical protein
MWTWDSTQIDFSQTCWTFDGSNRCEKEANGSVYGGGSFDDVYRLRERRKREDDLVIDFIKTIVTKGLI